MFPEFLRSWFLSGQQIHRFGLELSAFDYLVLLLSFPDPVFSETSRLQDHKGKNIIFKTQETLVEIANK